MTTAPAARRLSAPLTVVIDAVLVVVFCIIGRLSHDEGILGDIPGLLNTMWPFIVAVLVAHVIAILIRLRTDRLPAGAVIWAVTVAGGLLLRAVAGQGTALPFIIVATLTLALFLIGWRAVYALVGRVRARSLS